MQCPSTVPVASHLPTEAFASSGTIQHDVLGEGLLDSARSHLHVFKATKLKVVFLGVGSRLQLKAGTGTTDTYHAALAIRHRLFCASFERGTATCLRPGLPSRRPAVVQVCVGFGSLGMGDGNATTLEMRIQVEASVPGTIEPLRTSPCCVQCLQA